MVTLSRPKPIIAQTYPRTYTRGIQLFESDVYTPTRITEIRFCEYPYGAIIARKQHRHGIFRTYSPPPYNFSIWTDK